MTRVSLLILLCAMMIARLPARAAADDSFTPEGATRIDVNAGGAVGFLFQPTTPSAKGRPWIWYAPTCLDLAPGHQYPNAATHWLFTHLLAKGVWIAGMRP